MARSLPALLAAALLAPSAAAPQQAPAQPASPGAAGTPAGEVSPARSGTGAAPDAPGELPPPRAIPAPDPGAAKKSGKRGAKADAGPPPRSTILVEVIGTVKEIDRVSHRVTIDAAGGPVTLRLNRNTLVYGPGGLTTVLDVVPGASVRAGRDADDLAYWVTVRAPQQAPQPASTPAQGTGPGGGGTPPAGEGGAAPGTAPPAGPAPGSTSPGPPAGGPVR